MLDRSSSLGTVIGLAGALLATRYLGTLLYGITPTDPVPLGAVVLLLAAVAGLAALGPAIRAGRVEPLTAMHVALTTFDSRNDPRQSANLR